jgi:hypothetical protein
MRGWQMGSYKQCSIREFCDLKIPIFMFDKNEDFVVLKLEEVSKASEIRGRSL